MSNGSERMPERCVHAPDGPDWAGLRELPTPKPNYEALVEVALARYKLACEEMDRLTAGNPGNTWRWSIPANPDRDTDLILSASAEDVPRLVAAVEALLAMEQRLTDHIVQLAAERDALQAENTRLRTNMGVMSKLNSALEDERDLARIEHDRTEAERDALRAQLDSMTVETRRSRVRADAPPLILKIVDERRLVSPWTVAEGDDQ